MQMIGATASLLALFNLGGGEIILILALPLILVFAKKLPDFWQGLGAGFSKFRHEVDQSAQDAGQSLGGIYGKPAAQALTPDNQTAELYDPAVLSQTRIPGKNNWRSIRIFWTRAWHSFVDFLRKLLRRAS